MMSKPFEKLSVVSCGHIKLQEAFRIVAESLDVCHCRMRDKRAAGASVTGPRGLIILLRRPGAPGLSVSAATELQ